MGQLTDDHVYWLAETIVASSLDAIITVDGDGCIIGWNPAAAVMFGHPEAGVLGKSVSVIIPIHMRSAHAAGIHSYNETGVSRLAGSMVELTGLRHDETEFPIEMSIFHLRSGGRRFFTAIIRDISERKRLEKRLIESEQEMRRLATVDALTGLHNRRSALERLEIEIHRSARDDKPLSILMLDIDFFKRINDTHGHGAGDDVLQYVSELLRSSFRQNDTCGRLGGEEFLVILPECNETYALSLAEKLRRRLAAQPVPTRVTDISVTCSIGAAQWTRDTIEMFIGRADTALYSAKRNGRNQVAKPSL